MNHKIDRDTYIIPPNFIESGTFFGGMFKARNVIEAGILAFAIGVPVFSLLPLGLTARIIALCLTALPAALVALIGISGESLSSFLLIFIKYLRNRRIVGGNSAEDAVPAAEHGGKHIKKKAHKPDKAPRRSRRSGREDFPAEFDEVRGYEIRQKLRPVKKQKPAKEKKTAKQKKKVSKERKVKRPIRTQEPKPACLNPVADYLPISKIENGIIYTKDHRYVKVVEVVPINFMLRSAQEQRNIIYSFVSYLKISPIKLQIKVLTRRAEINRHLDTVRKEMEQETNEQCLLMQEDYLQFVQQIGSREAITRRFFLIFEYEVCDMVMPASMMKTVISPTPPKALMAPPAGCPAKRCPAYWIWCPICANTRVLYWVCWMAKQSAYRKIPESTVIWQSTAPVVP